MLPWQDVGSTILIAEGRSLQDNNRVLAKIANNQTNACLGLEREADLCVSAIFWLPLDKRITCVQIPAYVRVIEGHRLFHFIKDCRRLCCIINCMYPHDHLDFHLDVFTRQVHPGVNSLGRIFPASKVNELLFADASRLQPPPARADIYSMGIDEYEDAEYEALDVMDLASFLECVPIRTIKSSY